MEIESQKILKGLLETVKKRFMNLIFLKGNILETHLNEK